MQSTNLLDSESSNSNSSSTKDRPGHYHPLNPVDHLIAKVGIGIVDTVERYYARYCEKPNDVNARAYCLWRLRLHRRLKNDKALLDAINEARNLGLYDEAPGRLCWECEF